MVIININARDHILIFFQEMLFCDFKFIFTAHDIKFLMICI